jgi:hypothetical protein
MKEEVLRRLGTPYDWDAGDPMEFAFTDAIGVRVREVVGLGAAMTGDLNSEDFGIAWWRDMPLHSRSSISFAGVAR